jgi:hypothetical protein
MHLIAVRCSYSLQMISFQNKKNGKDMKKNMLIIIDINIKALAFRYEILTAAGSSSAIVHRWIVIFRLLI